MLRLTEHGPTNKLLKLKDCILYNMVIITWSYILEKYRHKLRNEYFFNIKSDNL